MSTPFIRKLWDMVGDPSNYDVIGWCEDGESFYVYVTEEMSKRVLPRYFSSSACSFVRQLNLYGFHRTPESTDKMWILRHEDGLFVKNQKHLILQIVRKVDKKKKRNEENEQLEENRRTKKSLTNYSPTTLEVHPIELEKSEEKAPQCQTHQNNNKTIPSPPSSSHLLEITPKPEEKNHICNLLQELNQQNEEIKELQKQIELLNQSLTNNTNNTVSEETSYNSLSSELNENDVVKHEIYEDNDTTKSESPYYSSPSPTGVDLLYQPFEWPEDLTGDYPPAYDILDDLE